MLYNACFDTARSALSFCKNMCRWCCYAQGILCGVILFSSSHECFNKLIVKTLNERNERSVENTLVSTHTADKRGFVVVAKLNS